MFSLRKQCECEEETHIFESFNWIKRLATLCQILYGVAIIEGA